MKNLIKPKIKDHTWKVEIQVRVHQIEDKIKIYKQKLKIIYRE